MGAPRSLRRPPITEALIDLRIASDPTIDARRLEGLKELLRSDYPKAEEKRGFKAELAFEGGKVRPSSQDLGFHGSFLSSSDAKRTAQFRRDGFTLNHLAPYPGAEALMTEAARLWRLYRDAVAPSTITRIGFRAINSLVLPLDYGEDYERFLTAVPPVPEPMPQAMSSFLSRVVTHEEPNVAVITQRFDPGAFRGSETEPPVILDIDVFQLGEFRADTEVWMPVLESLRELKNRVFFAFLTDAALELYV